METRFYESLRDALSAAEFFAECTAADCMVERTAKNGMYAVHMDFEGVFNYEEKD